MTRGDDSADPQRAGAASEKAAADQAAADKAAADKAAADKAAADKAAADKAAADKAAADLAAADQAAAGKAAADQAAADQAAADKAAADKPAADQAAADGADVDSADLSPFQLEMRRERTRRAKLEAPRVPPEAASGDPDDDKFAWEEYKLVQDKIDKVGNFRFVIKGWAIALASALLALALKGETKTGALFACAVVVVVLFYFVERFEQRVTSRLQDRVGELERLLKRKKYNWPGVVAAIRERPPRYVPPLPAWAEWLVECVQALVLPVVTRITRASSYVWKGLEPFIERLIVSPWVSLIDGITDRVRGTAFYLVLILVVIASYVMTASGPTPAPTQTPALTTTAPNTTTIITTAPITTTTSTTTAPVTTSIPDAVVAPITTTATPKPPTPPPSQGQQDGHDQKPTTPPDRSGDQPPAATSTDGGGH